MRKSMVAVPFLDFGLKQARILFDTEAYGASIAYENCPRAK
jgi:hypothetical protein